MITSIHMCADASVPPCLSGPVGVLRFRLLSEEEGIQPTVETSPYVDALLKAVWVDHLGSQLFPDGSGARFCWRGVWPWRDGVGLQSCFNLDSAAQLRMPADELRPLLHPCLQGIMPMRNAIQRHLAIVLEHEHFCGLHFVDGAAEGIEGSVAHADVREREPAVGEFVAVDVPPWVSAQGLSDAGVQSPGAADPQVTDGLAIIGDVASSDPDHWEICGVP